MLRVHYLSKLPVTVANIIPKHDLSPEPFSYETQQFPRQFEFLNFGNQSHNGFIYGHPVASISNFGFAGIGPGGHITLHAVSRTRSICLVGRTCRCK
jgi:hypothetical protein